MTASVGIALAFVAMLCWGFGDFLVQRTTRRLGDWETLFVLAGVGALILLPFIWREIPGLFSNGKDALILIFSGLFILAASLMNFEAFKKGKISVLEPLFSLEIISSAALAFFALNDRITWLQTGLIVLLIISLFLVSFRETRISRKALIEKGVLLFAAGSIVMGIADFLLGWGSRVTDPILATFTLNTVVAVISGVTLLFRGQMGRLFKDLAHYPASVLVMAVSENVAWVAYAVAMSLIAIAIATGLSESSIIVAVLLGLFINKEKLQRHQKIGLVAAIVAAIVLAFVTT